MSPSHGAVIAGSNCHDRVCELCCKDVLKEVVVLHWTYIAIAVFVFVLVLRELFTERNWRNQLALALVLIPLVLRILHIK